MLNVLGKAAAGTMVAACWLLPAFAWAQTKTISLSVDKTTVVVGETVILQVELTSSDDKVLNIAASQQVTLQPAGTQSSITIINGKMTSKNTAQYSFTPQQPGEYILGPATLQTKSGKLTSNTVKVIVQAGGSERFLQFQAIVKPKRVYVGQPFAAAVTAIYGSDMRPVGWNPATADGIVEIFDSNKSQQLQSTVKIAGQTYASLTLSRWLYANSPGTKKLSGGRLEFDVVERQHRRTSFPFAGFDPFGMRAIRQASELPPQTVIVRDLPPLPDNKNFVGAVGSFTVGWAQVEKHNNQLRAVMVLQGTGTAPAAHIDSWVDSGWRFYPDKPEQQYSLRDGSVWLTLKIPVIVVPVNDPPTAVPAWFDPVKGEYVGVPLPVPPREVVPVAPAAGDLAQQAVVAATGGVTAKRHLVAMPDGVLAASLTLGLAKQASALALGLLVLGFAVPLAFGQLRRRPNVRRLLDKALTQDTQAAWLEAAQALNALAKPSTAERALLEMINAALYAPTFTSPAARVRQLLKEQA